MGPYVIVRLEPSSGTAALAHTVVPTPPRQPATYISSVSALRLFDDSLAIAEFDIPADRFRQLAYVNHNARPINCILQYRALAQPQALPANHVSNYEYEVRFEDSSTLADTAWLPYSAIHHTFAFESFWACVNRELHGHQCVAIPSEHRRVHQSRASIASRHRAAQSNLHRAAAAFDHASHDIHSPPHLADT
jgi:hypothetical protein